MKTLKFISIFSAAVLFVSCNKFLDTMPDNRADLDNAENISKLLVSAYSRYQPATSLEWMSDNVDYNGELQSRYSYLQEQAFYWQDITDVDHIREAPSTTWEAIYLTIATANQALDAIDKLGNPESMNPLRGEALLCRAYGHFVLVNMFSLHYDPAKERPDNDYTDPAYYGIPYITTPETTVHRPGNRKNVCYVYERIDGDIEEALTLIGDDNRYSAPKFHFSREAAYAFASKFNLYYCKFEKAAEYATIALGANPKDKLRNWDEMYDEGDGMTRARLYVSDKARTNFLMSTVLSRNATAVNSSANSRYSHSIYTADNETIRSSGIWGGSGAIRMTITTWAGAGRPLAIVAKLQQFQQSDPVSNTVTNWNIWLHFTADETLLHRAEAYTMLGEYEKAAEDLSDIVASFTTTESIDRDVVNSTFGAMEYYKPEQPTPKKRLNPKFDFQQGGEQENFIHAILHCRRILFIHEGHRWYDIKRWGIQVDHREIFSGNQYVKTLDVLTPEDLRRAIQIPERSVTVGLAPNPR